MKPELVILLVCAGVLWAAKQEKDFLEAQERQEEEKKKADNKPSEDTEGER